MNSMTNTTNITIRIDMDLKESVDGLFKNLGMTTSTAINMFLRQCDRKQRLVFKPTMIAPPSGKGLIEDMHEMEDIKSDKIKAKAYHNVDVMFKDILNDKKILISENIL